MLKLYIYDDVNAYEKGVGGIDLSYKESELADAIIMIKALLNRKKYVVAFWEDADEE